MNYVAPEMEVLEVMVEAGFAGSNPFAPDDSKTGDDAFA